MSKYEELIIFILLKICKIISKSCNDRIDTEIFTIESKLKELKEGK